MKTGTGRFRKVSFSVTENAVSELNKNWILKQLLDVIFVTSCLSSISVRKGYNFESYLGHRIQK